MVEGKASLIKRAAAGSLTLALALWLAITLCSCAQSTNSAPGAATSNISKSVAAFFDNSGSLRSSAGETAATETGTTPSGLLQAQSYDPHEAEAMSVWSGHYRYDEGWLALSGLYVGETYELVIFQVEASREYFACVSICGYQTYYLFTAQVKGNAQSITLVFDSYFNQHADGGPFGPYSPGDVLLKLDRQGSNIITTWEKMQLVNHPDDAPGVYFQKTG